MQGLPCLGMAMLSPDDRLCSGTDLTRNEEPHRMPLSVPSTFNPAETLGAGLEERGIELRDEVGRGGAAVVYRAYDRRHGRLLAVKVLKPEVSMVLGADRFLREIQIAAALQHPHIMPIYDSGAVNGLPFYVMPYIEGESLRERISR